jgi:hypothetical protein
VGEADFGAVDDAIADAFYQGEDVVVLGVEEKGVYCAVEALDGVHCPCWRQDSSSSRCECGVGTLLLLPLAAASLFSASVA